MFVLTDSTHTHTHTTITSKYKKDDCRMKLTRSCAKSITDSTLANKSQSKKAASHTLTHYSCYCFTVVSKQLVGWRHRERLQQHRLMLGQNVASWKPVRGIPYARHTRERNEEREREWRKDGQAEWGRMWEKKTKIAQQPALPHPVLSVIAWLLQQWVPWVCDSTHVL